MPLVQRLRQRFQYKLLPAWGTAMVFDLAARPSF
jgi:hypothetical protein